MIKKEIQCWKQIKMEMERNNIKMVKYNLKGNITMVKDGMENDIILKEKKNMN